MAGRELGGSGVRLYEQRCDAATVSEDCSEQVSGSGCAARLECQTAPACIWYRMGALIVRSCSLLLLS